MDEERNVPIEFDLKATPDTVATPKNHVDDTPEGSEDDNNKVVIEILSISSKVLEKYIQPGPVLYRELRERFTGKGRELRDINRCASIQAIEDFKPNKYRKMYLDHAEGARTVAVDWVRECHRECHESWAKEKKLECRGLVKAKVVGVTMKKIRK